MVSSRLVKFTPFDSKRLSPIQNLSQFFGDDKRAAQSRPRRSSVVLGPPPPVDFLVGHLHRAMTSYPSDKPAPSLRPLARAFEGKTREIKVLPCNVPGGHVLISGTSNSEVISASIEPYVMNRARVSILAIGRRRAQRGGAP